MNDHQRSRIFWLVLCLVGVLIFSIITLALTLSRLSAPPAARPVAPASPSYDLGKEAQFVRLDSPRPGDKIMSPLMITGSARTWYFEGSFPVELKDGNGVSLATGQATAQGDWMSSNFVPFKATLTFAKPTTASGTLILKKDNPSGLPANDDQVSIPVQFDFNAPSWSASDPVTVCRISGCSGQICSDKNEISDCLYLPQYACYKSAICARQADGKCGWTQTSELKSCIAKARK